MKRKKCKGREFYQGAILLLVAFAFPIFGTSKGILELQLNAVHHPILDFSFLALTQLGDGIIFIPFVLLFLFRKVSFSIFLCLCGFFNALFIFIGKRLLFPGMPRPSEFLKEVDFYHVPGLELHHWNSFPSGHTTTAFSLAFAIAIIFSKRKKIQVALLILASMVGLSRVYLMQHFFLDIWVGAALGLIATALGKEITLKFFSGREFRMPLFKPKQTTVPSLRKQIILQQKLLG